jgi:hypothetical protein
VKIEKIERVLLIREVNRLEMTQQLLRLLEIVKEGANKYNHPVQTTILLVTQP